MNPKDVAGLEALLAQAKGEAISKKREQEAERYLSRMCDNRLSSTLSALGKSQYCALAGIPTSSFSNQAARLGLPVGRTINLSAVLKRHHELHAERARGPQADDIPDKKKLEVEQLQKKNALLDLDLRQRRGDFIDREELQLKLDWLVGRLRSIGAALGKKFGADAQRLLNQGLENIESDLSGEKPVR